MRTYYTPINVAQVLARHVPKNLSRILEPAAGTGTLLEPLAERLRGATKRVVCVDVNNEALERVKSRLGPIIGNRLKVVCSDFLEWSSPTRILKNEQLFDCILMNPPFAGRRENYVSINWAAELPGIGEGIHSVPTEVAFVLRSIRLLRPKGRLLAVVPSSLVSSLSTVWVRNYLLLSGAIRYVHELPRYTFKGLGSRVYLFVYEKAGRKQPLLLSNHDLDEPESIRVREAALTPELRFDYGFHAALRQYKELIGCSKHLGWDELRAVADIYRGIIQSPNGARKALHTYDFNNGFWHLANRKIRIQKDKTERGIKRGDLLMKRVGRICSSSAGKIIGHIGCASSDCLLIIRPNDVAMSLRLLFALRIILGFDFGAQLVERGTGAPYITEKSMLDLVIPLKLANIYHRQYSAYHEAIIRRNFDAMLDIEKRVRYLLIRHIKRCEAHKPD
ncbi:MAG: hypothetical protein QOE33_3045 [Acidobacteriota bacterium]|nr:hypothetical protein [Acidobacteriota bacterium]